MSAIKPVLRRAMTRLLRSDEGGRPLADPGASQQAFAPRYALSWFQEAGEAINDRGLFVGCPLELFELTARDPFCVALMEGMTRDWSVLEVGCGCLRVGYWFVQYLEAGRYFGLEPNVAMLDAGRTLILGSLETQKRPRFGTNDRFDFTEFGTQFDLVVAYSIWTHASKPQIEQMLDGFQAAAKPGAKLIASWIEPRPGVDDYQGTEWVGRSHESNLPGYVAHGRPWLEAATAGRGMKIAYIDDFTTITQKWLVITRP